MTREKFIEIFESKEVFSVKFYKQDQTVVAILPDHEFMLPEEKYKDYQIIEYLNREEISESNLLNLTQLTNEIEKYGFFKDDYNGKILLNNYDPDKIPEPLLDENGVLITKNDILKLNTKNKYVRFEFRKNNIIITTNHEWYLDEKTGKVDQDFMKQVVTVLSSDYIDVISDYVLDTIDDVILKLEELGVIINDEGYVYTINDRNPKYALEEIK